VNHSPPSSSRFRILLALVGLALVLVVAARLRQGSQAPAEAAPEAIRKVLDDQAKAWNSGDLDGFMAGYWQDQDSPDQKLTFSSSKGETTGWQATYERFRREYQAPDKAGPTHLIVQSLSAQGLAPAGAPLGALAQQLAAVGVMNSDAFTLSDKEMGTLRFSDLTVDMLGRDAALVRGHWQLTFRKGDPVGGLFTLIFQKKTQGWCIVHDHTSRVEPKAG
jgi:beta-aspartyl-peptidase (threonine type)